MNIALITAKGGNLSIPNKNLLEVEGKSLIVHVIHAAQQARNIHHVFVSTEDPLIRKAALDAGGELNVIDRPPHLATPDANHGEAILHGALQAQKRLEKAIDTVTILLGNSVMLHPDDIDRVIEALDHDTAADSAMTVWKAQDDHPYRAMCIGEDGYLRTFGAQRTTNTNRQSYPEVVFYDQGPWCVRMSVLCAAQEQRAGPACWWWMGKRSIPIERAWVTGKDVHSMLDVAIAGAWLRHNMRDIA